MKIGVIGLGRMGGNIVRRLMRAGHSCVVYDANPAPGQALSAEGAVAATSLGDLVKALGESERTVWVMLPAGKITEETIAELAGLMKAGDTIIDGGNTMFKDDVRRARELKPKGIHYLDVGTSGGVWGLQRGYLPDDRRRCGDREAARSDLLGAGAGAGHDRAHRRPRQARSARRARLHPRRPAGAGHFVKMIHNGIEYGMMQAFAEGFDIMKHRASDKLPADERFDLNLADIAEVWRAAAS
jgi:6-phosphogluconate dehydrogenase